MKYKLPGIQTLTTTTTALYYDNNILKSKFVNSGARFKFIRKCTELKFFGRIEIQLEDDIHYYIDSTYLYSYQKFKEQYKHRVSFSVCVVNGSAKLVFANLYFNNYKIVKNDQVKPWLTGTIVKSRFWKRTFYTSLLNIVNLRE